MSTIANSPFLPNQCAGYYSISPKTITLQQAYANNGAIDNNIPDTSVSSSFSDGYLTVPLYSENGDYLNNAYVMVFTNTSENYNLADKSYTGYFKFQGLDTAENAVYIIAVGGGGGGGSTTGNTNTGPGVGGGGGGTSLFWFNSFDSAFTYAVNVGAGGTSSNGYGGQASGGGNSFIDTLIPTSSNSFSFNYNLMTSYGGGGGAGNINLGGSHNPGGSGGGTTGIPNWGTYQSINVDNIGLGTFNGGGGGNYNGKAGSSTMPEISSLENTYATTYMNELPWFSYLQNFVPQLQNSYGGGGAAGGSVTLTYDYDIEGETSPLQNNQGNNGNYYSRGGQNGVGGAYLQPNIGNFSGSSGYSYGDGGGGAYYSEIISNYFSYVYEDECGEETLVTNETTSVCYKAALGGNGCGGCVIVIMILGYNSLACNQTTDSTINPSPSTPAPIPPPPPPSKSSSASAESSMSSDEMDCCEMTVSTSPVDQDNTIENINFIKKILASPEYKTIYTALQTNKRYFYLNYIQSSRLYTAYKKILHLIYYGSSKVRFYKQIPGSPCNYRSLVFMDTRRAYHLKSNVDISINIICVGGGGGGGEYLYGGLAGGGGAGGSINLKTINLINNELYEIKVGAGGQGAYDYYVAHDYYVNKVVGNGNNGACGGRSSVNSISNNQTLISADGGGGGYSYYLGGQSSSNGNYGSNSISGGNGGNGGYGSNTTLTGNHGTYYFNQPGSNNTTQITSIMPDYQNILTYFDTNNLQLTINGTLCQNIIQNVYSGGGGGGYYGTYNNSGVSVYGMPSVTGYSNGLPGGNGYGGTSGLAYYKINGSSLNNVNSNFIGGGGGGLCISNQPNNGYGGQGLVMMYWQATTTNEEEEKEGIKETVKNMKETVKNMKETGAIKEAMVDNKQEIEYCLDRIARDVESIEIYEQDMEGVYIYGSYSIG
uniref:Glycine-rich domain-containing protein n=1 Tax=viral metagenome TaxID=1070528 RepID=A0A6C0DKX5_9ZZZZ